MAINKVVATRKPIEIASNVFPHSWQLNGATKMRRLEQSFFQGGILADEMGLGKTLVALLLINMTRSIRAGPSLVICPKSCVKQWMRELSDNFKPVTPPSTRIRRVILTCHRNTDSNASGFGERA